MLCFALLFARVWAGCKDDCQAAIDDLPAALDCRTYRTMLPRPKVGKACTDAYADGAMVTCKATCEGAPVPSKDAKSADFCRKQLQEFPKPTVHKACRSGYALGFDKGLQAYTPPADAPPADTPVAITPDEPVAAPEPPIPEVAKEEAKEEVPPRARKLLASIPVTVDDEEIHLELFDGDDAESAVADFCAQYMTDSLDSCISQLTPHVQRKLSPAT